MDLKQARLAQGIGLRAMAKRLNLSPTYISHIEKGICKVSDQQAVNIEREYGIKLDRKPTYEELTAEVERLTRVVE